MAHKKLNSTGSLWTDGENFYSYRQQMTATYKGYRLFDSGFYSMTTRKHQCDIKRYYFKPMISLNHVDFNRGIEWSIENEIKSIDYDLDELSKKRKTQKALQTKKDLITKKEELTKLLNLKVDFS